MVRQSSSKGEDDRVIELWKEGSSSSARVEEEEVDEGDEGRLLVRESLSTVEGVKGVGVESVSNVVVVAVELDSSVELVVIRSAVEVMGVAADMAAEVVELVMMVWDELRNVAVKSCGVRISEQGETQSVMPEFEKSGVVVVVNRTEQASFTLRMNSGPNRLRQEERRLEGVVGGEGVLRVGSTASETERGCCVRETAES